MKKVVFRLTPGKGIGKDIVRLTGWNHVMNVVKKCSADLEKLYSVRDLSAKISSQVIEWQIQY